jgi:hypothetical protein
MDTQVVHVRINDAATGQPTPVRIRFVDATGRYRAPLGRLEHFPTGFGQQVGGNVDIDGKKFAYIDGACEILLPTGPIQVEVHKGFEYEPIFHTFHRAEGKISLRLSMERKFNLEAEGWYAGDICAHFLSPAAAWLEGAAEGLSVVNLLAAEWEDEHGHPFHSNLLDFTGQQEPPKKDGTLVAVNTLNRAGPLGDFLLLNSHRPVFPLRLGQEGFEHYTPLDWCRQCHRKGGLVVGMTFPAEQLLEQRSPGGGQWMIDALAWLPAGRFAQDLLPAWYGNQMKGWARSLPLVGGSGKTSNAAVLGAVRTYVRISGDDVLNRLSHERWIEGIRNGCTFVTCGPLLDLHVESQEPPVSDNTTRTAPTRQVRATARSLVPFERLELFCNGELVADATPDDDGVARIDQRCTLHAPAWLVVRCWGAGGQLLAHTSPAWVSPTGGTR